MIDYINAMVVVFTTKLKPDNISLDPGTEYFLAVGKSKKLIQNKTQEFYTFFAKRLFTCKRARPDLRPTITALSMQVNNHIEEEWKKLLRFIRYINGTRKNKLILSVDDLHVIKWYVDSAFSVHADFNILTAGIVTYGRVLPISQ